jgi:cobalt-zinc-cadmium efflux system outer membrane protein
MRREMRVFLPRLTLAVSIALIGPTASAAQESLTLEQALERARERSPSVLAARARIEEARARLAGASLLLRENPELEAAAGGRSSAENDTEKVEVGILQNLDIGGRRSARIGIARAELVASAAESENALRQALRSVAAAFFRALHAQERLNLADRAEAIATEILEIARRRHEAGDVSLLDVNLAQAALSRARADEYAARSSVSAAFGDLRALLALPPEQEVKLAGELRLSRRYDLGDLLARATDRPDIRALRSEVEAASAEHRLGKALAWPEFGIGGRYEREEGDDRLLGAVRLTLPLFDRGQAVRAEARARTRRLELELEAALRDVRREIRTAFEVYTHEAAAADELARNAVRLLEENESLSRESYEAGQISLAELLLVRREILETRTDYLSHLQDAAIAGANLEASAGVLP